MFTLRQYLTTLADTHGLTRTLGEIEVCRDGKGRICYSAGNSAVVFRIRCEGRVRSLRCYMHHPRHLAEIYGEKLLPQELFIYTSPAGGVWVDVVLSDWIEGVTLHEAVAAAAEAGDTARLRRFAAAFDRMAAALTADDWAHGDLKPENIVADNRGRLHLIDFDAMFLPAFAGRHSPELGTAAFQHPARTVRDFDASLDDYPAALISTALHALALDPTLYARYSDADGLLFTPQKIGTDAALCEVLALFERRGLAAQYRIARLLRSPSLRLPGLPQLLALAAETTETDEINEECSEYGNDRDNRNRGNSRNNRPKAGNGSGRNGRRKFRLGRRPSGRLGRRHNRGPNGRRRRRSGRAFRRKRPVGLPHAGTGRRAAALRLRIRLHRRAGGGTARSDMALYRRRGPDPDQLSGVRSREAVPQRTRPGRMRRKAAGDRPGGPRV